MFGRKNRIAVLLTGTSLALAGCTDQLDFDLRGGVALAERLAQVSLEGRAAGIARTVHRNTLLAATIASQRPHGHTCKHWLQRHRQWVNVGGFPGDLGLRIGVGQFFGFFKQFGA